MSTKKNSKNSTDLDITDEEVKAFEEATVIREEVAERNARWKELQPILKAVYNRGDNAVRLDEGRRIGACFARTDHSTTFNLESVLETDANGKEVQ